MVAACCFFDACNSIDFFFVYADKRASYTGATALSFIGFHFFLRIFYWRLWRRTWLERLYY